MRGIRQEELLVKAVREQIPLGVAVMATGSASFIYIPETGGKGIPCGLLLVRARLLWYRTLISLALRACARARRLFSSLTIQTFSFSDNGIPQNSVSPPQRKRLKKNATVCANGCAVARQELEFFSRREIVNGTAAHAQLARRTRGANYNGEEKRQIPHSHSSRLIFGAVDGFAPADSCLGVNDLISERSLLG